MPKNMAAGALVFRGAEMLIVDSSRSCHESYWWQEGVV
jgi:hypothetical protein